MRRAPIATTALLMTLAVGAVVIAQTESVSGAPDCPATTLTRTGLQTSQVYTANSGGTWDLTGATWTGTSNYADVNADPMTTGCVNGGSTDGQISRTATRDCWFDGSGCTKANKGDGFTMNMANSAGNWGVIKNTYTEDYEDAYDLQSDYTTSGSGVPSVYLDHTEAYYIGDDCLENEGSSSDPDVPVGNVYINNSLWDNCFTGLAWRPPGATSQANGTRTDFHLTIEDSLIHIGMHALGSNYCSSSQVTSGRCTANGSTYLGLYGIWKWSDQAPLDANVTVSNTIFKLDGQSYSSCKPWDWPNGTYMNVTLVWDSLTSYNSLCSGTQYNLPSGVTLTTDVSVWDNAKAAWLAGDPEPTAESPTTDPPTTSSPPPTTGATTEPPPTSPSSEPAPATSLGCPVIPSPTVGQTVICTFR